jgi:hypothetical protein
MEEVSCKWAKYFWAAQGGIILILQTKEVGAYFIPIRTPKGFVIIHNFLISRDGLYFL